MGGFLFSMLLFCDFIENPSPFVEVIAPFVEIYRVNLLLILLSLCRNDLEKRYTEFR